VRIHEVHMHAMLVYGNGSASCSWHACCLCRLPTVIGEPKLKQDSV
jgi:hypothetical protein